MTKAINLFKEQGQGGSGADPDAVKFTPQSLTAGQKMQARSNIDADVSITTVDASTDPPFTMEPDKVYKYGLLSGDTIFPALATPTNTDIANVYCWTFTTSATAPTITWPSAITSWAGGSAPTINASKSYEVSVMDGLATIIEN